jgi:dienelactone hydrolase
MDWRYNNEVNIPVRSVKVKGELVIPLQAQAIVIFSHGSGSSRLSPRNQMVAKYLHQRNFGTLLFDLLTEEEDQQYRNRFDIELLTKRLTGATEWLEGNAAVRNCSLGYFGASTGAASAIKAAGYLPGIGAVVSRGGRPDLAGEIALSKLESPSLLIVGSLDHDVIKLNQWAEALMKCEKKLAIVPGASHLFEERGTMEKVCELAAGWFEKYLQPVKV